MKLILPFLLLASIAVGAPTAVTLTHGEANQLYLALNAIQPGLSTANTGIAADDINALEPFVHSSDIAKAKVQHNVAKAAKADKDAVAVDEMDSLQSFMESTVTVQLEPIKLTEAEISDAKITPALYAPLKRFLSTAPKK